MNPLDNATDAEIGELMTKIGMAMRQSLPPGTMFAVVLWSEGKDPRTHYVSNVRPKEGSAGLRELAGKLIATADRVARPGRN